jgi:hypothetical protein
MAWKYPHVHKNNSRKNIIENIHFELLGVYKIHFGRRRLNYNFIEMKKQINSSSFLFLLGYCCASLFLIF